MTLSPRRRPHAKDQYYEPEKLVGEVKRGEEMGDPEVLAKAKAAATLQGLAATHTYRAE